MRSGTFETRWAAIGIILGDGTPQKILGATVARISPGVYDITAERVICQGLETIFNITIRNSTQALIIGSSGLQDAVGPLQCGQIYRVVITSRVGTQTDNDWAFALGYVENASLL